MRILTVIFLMLLSYNLFAQNKISGIYRNYFGSRIVLNSDSTFEYTWHFDMSGSWTNGKWLAKHDTVYFQMIPRYDTISYKNNNGTATDKLILSADKKSERMTSEQFIGLGLPSGGQNYYPYPEKLVYKKGRLYGVKNGRLIKKKEKHLWTKKKWNPWFFKSDD